MSIPSSQHQVQLRVRDLKSSLLLLKATMIWIEGKMQLTFWRNNLESSARVQLDFNFSEIRNCPRLHMTSAKFHLILLTLQVCVSLDHCKYNLLICVQTTRSLLKIRTQRYISTALRKYSLRHRKCGVRGYIHELFVSKPERARYERVRAFDANNEWI